jgi:isoamylase
VHWDQADRPLLEFTADLVRLRRSHPTFQRRLFFTGDTVRTPVAGGEGDRLDDIVWLGLSGKPMEDGDWTSGSQAIGMYLNGQGIAGTDARGQRIVDDHFLLYFNADGEADATLPSEEYAADWDVLIDTGGSADDHGVVLAGSTLRLAAGSVVVLREHREPEVEPDLSVAASVALLTEQSTSHSPPQER